MNKTAVVTGSSRGIGAATAIRLASDGFDVCITYLSNKSAAEDVVAKITSSDGSAIAVQADISVESDVVNLFAVIDEKFGRLDVLVNNAGVLFQQSRLEDMDAARINAVLATNVTGYFLCCKEAIKRMSTTHGRYGGVIVNVSSGAARIGSPAEYIDYAAPKGAIDTLTIGLASEVADQGIRVNAVRPGFIYTDMHASGGEPDRVERVKQNIPLKRGGQPEEVAAAISWLASDESSFSSGTFIDVSGGR